MNSKRPGLPFSLINSPSFCLLSVAGFLRSPFFQAPISLFSPFPPYSLLLSTFFSPDAFPTPIYAFPLYLTVVDMSAKSMFTSPIVVSKSVIPEIACSKTSSANENAEFNVILVSVVFNSLSFNITIRSSTFSFNFCVP